MRLEVEALPLLTVSTDKKERGGGLWEAAWDTIQAPLKKVIAFCMSNK